jgi:hypothetical protein
MKTKISFAVGFLLAAVLAASAESYTITVKPGWNLIANQLEHPGGNTLDQILPLAPDNIGSLIQKYDVAIQNGVLAGTWNGSAWDQPSTLLPGEGGFLYYVGTSDLSLTFTGTRLSPLVPLVPVPGFQLVSDQLPNPGNWNSVIAVPPGAGTIVSRFDATTQQWAANTFDGSAWSLGAPTANVGEAWYLYYVAAVPEPATSAFLGLGVAALIISRRRSSLPPSV